MLTLSAIPTTVPPPTTKVQTTAPPTTKAPPTSVTTTVEPTEPPSCKQDKKYNVINYLLLYTRHRNLILFRNMLYLQGQFSVVLIKIGVTLKSKRQVTAIRNKDLLGQGRIQMRYITRVWKVQIKVIKISYAIIE